MHVHVKVPEVITSHKAKTQYYKDKTVVIIV